MILQKTAPHRSAVFKEKKMITKNSFGTLPCGKEVFLYSLSNKSRLRADISNFGGTVVRLIVKDREMVDIDVVCGFENVDGYLNASGYQGAIIGRVCNRIKESRFTLDGVEYELFANDGKNSAHGGKIGFNKRVWDVVSVTDGDEPTLTLRYVSPDMEENFPGELTVTVTYTLTEKGGLKIRYEATTDKNTVINLTNHSYFNLHGCGNGNVKDLVMWIDADKINEQDFELIPTGNFLTVKGGAYDFTVPKAIGRDFDSEPSMDIQHGGYDNNYIINNYDGTVKLCATLKCEDNGIKMDVLTDQPCVQIYTSNMIDENDIPFKGGKKQMRNCAVCFETQHMPDAIHHPNFTNTVLRPGEKYDYTTVYEFSVED